MQTRSQKKATNNSGVKQSTIGQSTVGQSTVKQEEICAICCDVLDTEGLTKTLHSGPNWKHCFHYNCIDEWYFACIDNNKTPCCPLCPNTPFPDDYVSQQLFTQCAVKMFKTIKLSSGISPYIGIMVYIDGECKFKLTNLDLCNPREWGFNSADHHELTIYDIKAKILEMRKQIYNKYGNPNETWKDTISNLLYSECPKIKIVNTCYAIPPYAISSFDMNNLDNNSTLQDIYVDYHTQLEEMKNDPSTDFKTHELISNISTEKHIRMEGYEGYYVRGYFNPENPNVLRATYFPWAWIAVHLEYE